MRPLWFFHLYILSSATTALSTLCQGRLYPHIYIYIYNFFFSLTFINQSMVTYIYIYVAIGGKTERLYFHPFKLISWKQACKDESIVSLFFSPYYNIYHALLLCIEHCKTEKSIHRLPISFLSLDICSYVYIFMSDERLGAKLRVREKINESS